ncbi:transposable element Tc3 transposase [Trichonephila clavipes]|nr:transposable element Tc3 transposase [Trichonephila clavipes]
MDSDDEDQDITFDFSAPTQWGMPKDENYESPPNRLAFHITQASHTNEVRHMLEMVGDRNHLVVNHLVALPDLWRAVQSSQINGQGFRNNVFMESNIAFLRPFNVGTAIRGSVVVVHAEEPHPQMTGTLSYRPEETGGRQREKSLDTRHRRLDDLYRVLPWPEDCTWWSVCTTPCTVCTFNACPSEKAFFVVPGTPELRDNEWGRVLFTDESRFSLSSDSHRILIWRERGNASHPSNIIETDRGAMGLQFVFMDDNAPCYRTVAAKQLLESEDIEPMDWPA